MKWRLAVAATGAAVALAAAGLAIAQPGAGGGKNPGGNAGSNKSQAGRQTPPSSEPVIQHLLPDVEACIHGDASQETCSAVLADMSPKSPFYGGVALSLMVGEIDAGRPVSAIHYGDLVAAQRGGQAADLVRCTVRVLAKWDLDAGFAACNAAGAADPGVAELRGQIHLMAGRWDDAWNDFDAAYRTDKGSQSLFLRGLAAAGRGKMADAVKDMAQAEQEAPGTTDAFGEAGYTMAAVMAGKPLAPPEAFAPMGAAALAPPQNQAQAPTAPPRANPAAPVAAAIIKFAPDAPRGDIAPLSAAQAAQCEEALTSADADSAGWKGTPEETALRLGLMQRTLYAGRCAGHPNAKRLVADAEREIAASAASAASAFTDAKDTTPDVINCVEPMAPNNPRNKTGSPALHNACNFPVHVAYCNVSPARGSWAEMFTCGVRSALGMDVIPANGATPAVFGREIQHFACRQPAGPVLTYVAGKGLDGFCK